MSLSSFMRGSSWVALACSVSCSAKSVSDAGSKSAAPIAPAHAGAAPKSPGHEVAVLPPTSEGDGAARSDAGAEAQAVPVIPTDMLAVPAGRFVMGADGKGERDEAPAHEVTIGTFLLDKVEVTNEAYDECVRARACQPYRTHVAEDMKLGPDKRFRGPTQPVVGVSWFDAKAYCEWRGKRLPSEAEWEKAARGPDGRSYPWGETDPDPDRLACFAGSRTGATLPVGSFPNGAGPYGHLDLTGNVWEWTADLYDPYAYKRPGAARGVPGTCDEIQQAQDELRTNHQQGYTGTNPIPVECERVLRGGAFNYNGRGLRASNRVHHAPNFRLVVAGFRCAGDLPPG